MVAKRQQRTTKEAPVIDWNPWSSVPRERPILALFKNGLSTELVFWGTNIAGKMAWRSASSDYLSFENDAFIGWIEWPSIQLLADATG